MPCGLQAMQPEGYDGGRGHEGRRDHCLHEAIEAEHRDLSRATSDLCGFASLLGPVEVARPPATRRG